MAEQPFHGLTSPLGKRICPHCLSLKRQERTKRGGLRKLPRSIELFLSFLPEAVTDRLRNHQRHIPIHAWLDPGPNPQVLNLLVRGPQRGTHYLSLWIEDIQAILNSRSATPALYTLSPDVRLLEILGERIVKEGFPRSWLKALRRGYVRPVNDMTRDATGLVGKIARTTVPVN